MRLAAIDIGSNAIRLQIVKVFEEDELVSFKKLEFLRFPLRLGQDVFRTGKISNQSIERYSKLMKTFKLLIELYDVEGYFAVGTSAMREANNGQEVRNLIEKATGIDIRIITGTEEASILNKAIIPYLTNGQVIHVDVGGGSTELNLYESKKLKASKSFEMGSVRSLTNKKREANFKIIKGWISEAMGSTSTNILGIGTGGNINKLFKLSSRSTGSSISLIELKAIRAYVKEYSNDQRISILKMNHDRADVIIPASDIYIRVLEAAGSDKILVPKVGLKDGIIYELYERTTNRDITNLEFLEEH